MVRKYGVALPEDRPETWNCVFTVEGRTWSSTSKLDFSDDIGFVIYYSGYHVSLVGSYDGMGWDRDIEICMRNFCRTNRW
jgi:hypothetical protein